MSDPVDFQAKPLSSLAVSYYLPNRTGITSVHWDGAQTTYVSGTGDKSKDGSLTVQPGEPLQFRYRVVIHPGDVTTARIAGLYKQYTSTSTGTSGAGGSPARSF